MAMIKCPECGKEISDKAKQCIHCGCPIGIDDSVSEDYIDNEGKNDKMEAVTPDKRKNTIKLCAIIGILVLVLVIVVVVITNIGKTDYIVTPGIELGMDKSEVKEVIAQNITNITEEGNELCIIKECADFVNENFDSYYGIDGLICVSYYFDSNELLAGAAFWIAPADKYDFESLCTAFGIEGLSEYKNGVYVEGKKVLKKVTIEVSASQTNDAWSSVYYYSPEYESILDVMHQSD